MSSTHEQRYEFGYRIIPDLGGEAFNNLCRELESEGWEIINVQFVETAGPVIEAIVEMQTVKAGFIVYVKRLVWVDEKTGQLVDEGQSKQFPEFRREV